MTPDLSEIEAAAAHQNLAVVGVTGGTVLLGPLEPGFWAAFTKSPEWLDGQPDPMDRWSDRVISQLADGLGADALFPFGPKAGNFLQLALDSGTAWSSPVGMLVHCDAGLMVSYRGALVFDEALPPGATPGTPCIPCERPCTTACPIGALTADGYDIPACKAHIASPAGADCLENGCLARRACPVSQTFARDPAQSGYHMERFLG